MALIIRKPPYVHAFTYTKSCSLDSRKTLTDNDSNTVGLELRASEIGFPPAVQRLAGVASTLLYLRYRDLRMLPTLCCYLRMLPTPCCCLRYTDLRMLRTLCCYLRMLPTPCCCLRYTDLRMLPTPCCYLRMLPTPCCCLRYTDLRMLPTPCC